MDQVLRDDQPASMADKIAAINVARALFGPAAARKMWADFGMPEAGSANRWKLRTRIVKLVSSDAGMTLGVLANRCRTFRHEEVDREVKALVSEGTLRSESVKGGNGKLTERFFAV